MIDCQANVLDITPEQVAQLLLDKGGSDLGEVLQRRYVCDIESGDTSRWVLLRDTDGQVTLTAKEIDSDAIAGTHESETEVGDSRAPTPCWFQPWCRRGLGSLRW